MSLSNDLTPADISAITGNNNNDGFGCGGGAWWIIVLFLFVFCGGWGNGFGGFGGGSGANGSGFQGYATRADINEGFISNNLQRGISSIQQGICDSTYALNNTISNGFNNTNMAMLNGFNNSNTAMMGGFNSLQAQIAQCCCDNRYDALSNANTTQRIIENGFSNVGYQMATDTCALNTNANNNTRDIIEAQNASTRAILDKLNMQEMNAKDAQITALTQQVNALQLSASQSAQNSYLVNALRPAPVPAYTVPAPFGCGCNPCGCGC